MRSSMRDRSTETLLVSALAAAILALSVAQLAFGATATTSAWKAKVGPSGLNGTANVSTVTTGAGSIGLKLVKPRASSPLPVVVYKGTCASVGPVLFRLPSIKTTSSGSASRTSSLTTTQVNLILTATKGTGKIAIRVGSGTSVKCGAFARRTVLGPQAVVQAFYDWYLIQIGVVPDLHARRDLTSGFVSWAEHYNDGQMFGADPIVCAQDFPQSISAGAAAISGAVATVKITEVFNENQILSLKVTLGPSGWQISKGGC